MPGENNCRYHLGIDLGVASLSYTIRKEHVVDGVVIKNEILPPYVELFKPDSAEFRRGKRSASRNVKRKWTRVQQLCKLFDIDHSTLVQFQISKESNHAPFLKYKSLKNNTILTKIELLACLVHYTKYRNYSDSFDISLEKSKNDYKKRIEESDEIIKNHNYCPTIAWFEDDFFKNGKNYNWKNTRFMKKNVPFIWIICKKYGSAKNAWKYVKDTRNNPSDKEKSLISSYDDFDSFKKKHEESKEVDIQALFKRERWKSETEKLLEINLEKLPCKKNKILDLIYTQRYAETSVGKGNSLEEVIKNRDEKKSYSKKLSYQERNALYNHTSFVEKIGYCPYYIKEKKVPKIIYENVKFVLVNELIKIKPDLQKALFLLGSKKCEKNCKDVGKNCTTNCSDKLSKSFSRKSISYLQEIARDFLNLDNLKRTLGVTFLNERYSWFKELKKNHSSSEEYILLTNWFNKKGVRQNININLGNVLTLFQVIAKINKDVSLSLNLDEKKYDSIAFVLYNYFTPKLRREELIKKCSFLQGNEQIIDDYLLELNVSGTSNFSLNALVEQNDIFFKKDISSFEKLYEYRNNKRKEGERLSGFDISKSIGRLESHTNPIVFSAISRIKKHIYKLLKKGFFFDSINIEIGSELSLSKKAKDVLHRHQTQRRDERIKIRSKLKDLNERVNETNINRYICWKQQGEVCIYTGDTIEEEEIFSKDYELDHIIPRSILPIDSLENKVLVKYQSNRKKGNNTPLGFIRKEEKEHYLSRVAVMRDEWFKKDRKNKIDYRSREDHLCFVSKTKLDFLLCKNEDKYEIARGFLSRDLNNTKYLSKSICSYLSACIKTDEDLKPEKQLFHQSNTKKTTRINSISGQLTSIFRKQLFKNTIWGGEKLRDVTDWHHAIDSICLSLLSSSIFNKNNHFILKIKTICLLNKKETLKEKNDLWRVITFNLEETNKKIEKINKKYEKNGKTIRLPLINYKKWKISVILDSLKNKDSINFENILLTNVEKILEKIPIKLRNMSEDNVDNIKKKDLNDKIFLDKYDSFATNNVKIDISKKIPRRITMVENLISKEKVKQLNKSNEWSIIDIIDNEVVEARTSKIETSFYCPLKGTKILRKVNGRKPFTISYMEIGNPYKHIIGYSTQEGKWKKLKTITVHQAIQGLKKIDFKQRISNDTVITPYLKGLSNTFKQQGYQKLMFISGGDIVKILKRKGDKEFLFTISSLGDSVLYGNYPGYRQTNFCEIDTTHNGKGYINLSSIRHIKHYNSNYLI